MHVYCIGRFGRKICVVLVLLAPRESSQPIWTTFTCRARPRSNIDLSLRRPLPILQEPARAWRLAGAPIHAAFCLCGSEERWMELEVSTRGEDVHLLSGKVAYYDISNFVERFILL